MTKLADVMETIEPEAFNMAYYWSATVPTICGTAGCLAGWQTHTGPSAEIVRRLEDRRITVDHFEIATRDLGLTRGEARELFTNSYWWAEAFLKLGLRDTEWYRKYIYNVGASPLSAGFDIAQITSKEAVIVLRALVDGTLSLL
jgi:hypothetical protein